jgi:hypothetical protein
MPAAFGLKSGQLARPGGGRFSIAEPHERGPPLNADPLDGIHRA